MELEGEELTEEDGELETLDDGLLDTELEIEETG